MERSSLDVFYPCILPCASYTFQSIGLISARSPYAPQIAGDGESAAGRLRDGPPQAFTQNHRRRLARGSARRQTPAAAGPPQQIAALNTLKRHHPG
jgi:hypothetical protein